LPKNCDANQRGTIKFEARKQHLLQNKQTSKQERRKENLKVENLLPPPPPAGVVVVGMRRYITMGLDSYVLFCSQQF
jgi:hypothetical protein